MQIPSRFTVCAIVFVGIVSFTEAKDQNESSLWPIQRMLVSKKFVDLTHEFAPGIPHWAGFPDETRKTLYWYDKRPDTMGAGFFSELFTHVGQWGTHVDPPAHFAKGLRTVDQIDPKEMILPMALIDVHEDVAQNPDYTLSIERVKKWEADYGQFPAAAFVAMRTDWSKRWPDANKMANKRRERRRALPRLELAGAETFWAQTIIKSSCLRISIKSQNPALSLSSVSRSRKAGPVFPRA